MAQNPSDTERSKKEKETHQRQPDAETLHTTDPQEHMKGPISSLMQKVKEGAEENDQKDKAEAEKEEKGSHK